MFTLQNYPYAALKLPGLTLDPKPFDAGISRYDLAVDVFQRDGTLDLFFEYNTDLFDASTIRRMQAHFVTILAGMVTEPANRISEICLLSQAEREDLLADAEPARTPFPSDRCVHELIREQCRCTPTRVAVACGAQELTYGELDELSDRIAAKLERSGIRPGVIVGVCLERSVRLPAALLAILKAGGAYLPLDLQYPQARLGMMLEDSGAAVLVTESSLVGKVPSNGTLTVLLDEEELTPDRPVNATTPDDLAYLLYTSGSTGKPKGVAIPHRALVNFLWSMMREPGIGPDDRLLQVTTLSFDIAGLEIYLPLLVVARNRDRAARGSVRSGGDRAYYRRTWCDDDAGHPSNVANAIRLGMEWMHRSQGALWRRHVIAWLAERLLNACGEVWNLYGPTETTIWSTAARLRQGMEYIPLGGPVANTSLYVLDGRRATATPRRRRRALYRRRGAGSWLSQSAGVDSGKICIKSVPSR